MKSIWKSYYPRLFRRNHNFYIRIAIPRELWYISKRKEIKYSLKTSNYADALFKMRCESIKADFFIHFLKSLDMRKRNGFLVLEDDDIEKLVVYRLKEIDKFCEDYKYALTKKLASFDDIALFSQKKQEEWFGKHLDANKVYDAGDVFIEPMPDETNNASNEIHDPAYSVAEPMPEEWDFVCDTTKNKIMEFLKYLKERPETPENIVAMIDECLCGNLIPKSTLKHIPQAGPDLSRALRELDELDKYAKKQVDSVINDMDFVVPRKYQPYVKAIELEKAQQMIRPTSTKTKWSDIATTWLKEKQLKKTKKMATLRQYATYLTVIFPFLGKEYVEDITKSDIKKVCYDLYALPKDVVEKLKKRKNIRDVLIDKDSSKALSKKTVQQYLIAFASFMKYAKKEGYISDSFTENFVIPSIDRAKPQKDAFTESDLLLIFNPKYYPYHLDEAHSPHFWLPLLALYTGNRIGELAQLSVNDAVIDEKVKYIKIYGDNDDKSLKTTASWREIPIHPDLIKLGFVDYVKQMKKRRCVRLFPTLNKDKNNHNGYGNAVGKWFNERYLDWIGVKSPTKTFHSFRYTLKRTLRPLKIPKESLNAILGWDREDIGDSVYGGIIPAKELYQDYVKLRYPFLEQSFEALKAETRTHYKMTKRKIRSFLQEENKKHN